MQLLKKFRIIINILLRLPSIEKKTRLPLNLEIHREDSASRVQPRVCLRESAVGRTHQRVSNLSTVHEGGRGVSKGGRGVSLPPRVHTYNTIASHTRV